MGNVTVGEDGIFRCGERRLVPPYHKPHDLIILGQGPSMYGCPFDSEVWASLSVLGHKGFEDKPYSKAFCFDNKAKKPDEQAGYEVAIARDIPIVGYQTQVIWNEKYPIREIRRRFGHIGFWNDTSYMIALALAMGYKSLLFYGIDGGPEPLYCGGRPFTTYWLGVATGMGVQWGISPASILWRHEIL